MARTPEWLIIKQVGVKDNKVFFDIKIKPCCLSFARYALSRLEKEVKNG